MRTPKILALTSLGIIIVVTGALAATGSIKLSAAFLTGMIMGMMLPLGLAAVFGVPRRMRSLSFRHKPPGNSPR